MKPERTIKRGQAIHPYGPGAILDWGQECFVVMDTRRGGWRHARKIKLERLQKRLGAPDGFRLPPIETDTNRGRGPALRVQRFPSWLFCPRCRRMWRWGRAQETAADGRLPRCGVRECKNTILVPMRYVAVCEGGHMSDVDWWRWAHSGRQGREGPCDRTSPELFFQADSKMGATLQALSIKCGRCGARRDLRDILATHALESIGQKCDDRQPWEKRPDNPKCDHKPRVLQRSQTAVHFSDVVSALDLRAIDESPTEELDGALADIVERFAIESPADAEPLLPRIVKVVSQEVGFTVEKSVVQSWLRKWFSRAANGGASSEASGSTGGELELLNEEWPALTSLTEPGASRAPLVVTRDAWPGVRESDARLAKLIEAVFLIERLREVRVLKGFRRIGPEAVLVPPDLGREPRQRWLPATEVFGEGIFLQFSTPALVAWEAAEGQGLNRRLVRIRERLQAEGGPAARFSHLRTLSARFMLVHTFSHLLMRQLCYECGYGGASIRERLYVFDDRAGVLIYTAAGDSEGSLGGLVRQGRTDRLGATIAACLERGFWCSNDPICSEIPEHGFEKLDLAACHACAFSPETSCTHLNALLDRELVIGAGDRGVHGFFSSVIAEGARSASV